MPYQILSTKLYLPPPAPNRVQRPGLVQRLEAGLGAGKRLTLVSAPAGFGKTTLVSAWLAAPIQNRKSEIENRLAWLSLDEADDEPGRFLLYFLAALQQTEPSFGAELFAALQAGQLPPVEVLVTTLVNAMSGWENPHFLVLDDFQVIHHPAILAMLDGLLAHQPESFHLVLVTREDPALPLARLRARGQLTEIRAADLRFSDEESAYFLRDGLGLALSAGDVVRLTERTEGWAVGLQLAGLSLQGRENPGALIESLSGSHRFILGYLTEEVLKRLPAETQDFLLQTSILSSLSGDLCDAVTGATDGVTRLESLLAANLFLVPLDDEGRWYRYHHLFADLLQTQLRRAHSAQVADLHRRASGWYERNFLPAEAIEHALAARDNERVANLLEISGWALLNQGYARQMEAWMQALPPELRVYSPRASLGFAWMHLLRGNFSQSLDYVRQAQAASERLAEGETSAALRAESLTLEANLLQAQGNIPASMEAAQAALRLIGPENTRLAALAWLALGGAYRQSAGFDLAVETLQKAARASQESRDWVTWMLAISHLTLMSIQHGRLRFAAETAARAVEQVQRLGIAPPPIVGAVYGALGQVSFETGQLAAAREYLTQGIRLGTFSGHNASLVYTKVHLARLLQAEGDLEAATRTLEEVAELFRTGAPGWARPEFVYRQTSLLLAMGKTDAAEAALRQTGLTPAAEITRRSDWLHLAWLRLLVFQRDPAALPLAERILRFAEADQRNGTTLQALVLGALAGADWLPHALQLAEPEGYFRLFVDEGEQMRAIMKAEFRRMKPDDPRRAYLEKILAVPNLPSAPMQPSTLNLQLTERELEVLRLLAEGLSYAEIADRLVVSVNTVRYHVKGMYGKLGVEKQVQAVEKGRELGLL